MTMSEVIVDAKHLFDLLMNQNLRSCLTAADAESTTQVMTDGLTEIVRCRDCVMLETESDNLCLFNGLHVNPDGFCAWGERHE